MPRPRSLVVALLGLVSVGSPAVGQDWLSRDSLVLRQLERRAPCPKPVPVGWMRNDSTLGHSPLCSLLAATAQVIPRSPTFVESGLLDPYQPSCVVLTKPQTATVAGDGPRRWHVQFVFERRALAPLVMWDVTVDPATGEVLDYRLREAAAPDSGYICRRLPNSALQTDGGATVRAAARFAATALSDLLPPQLNAER